MRHITVSVPTDDQFERLLAQQEEVRAEIESFRAGDRLGRVQLHHRATR